MSVSEGSASADVFWRSFSEIRAWSRQVAFSGELNRCLLDLIRR